MVSRVIAAHLRPSAAAQMARTEKKHGGTDEDIAQNGGKGYLGFLGVLRFCQDVS
jgi:hypothetical protein